LACAAAAAGADGIIVEVHPHPEKSRSDAKQTLGFPEFREMVKWVTLYAAIAARRRAVKQQEVVAV
ncbi:MAG: 3-deoxy-7-phosphoheptulonate synthase, partial [bacterium]|nr:3-deoxy-7-phosphoheptulonate synthase [bacterium]